MVAGLNPDVCTAGEQSGDNWSHPVGLARPSHSPEIQDLCATTRALTLEDMSLLTLPSRARRPRRTITAPPTASSCGGPLPAPLRHRVQLSADLVSALLQVEGRRRPTLDDLEWADAVAARMA